MRPSKTWLIFLWLVILASGCAARVAPSPSAAPPGAVAPSETRPSIGVTQPYAGDPFAAPRAAMVRDTIAARGIVDDDVLRAMRTVPRHQFVPSDLLQLAYADHPLPIGYGQTISQPYIVAWMTELLDLKEGDRVLEIGTGSGYQAAVLAELGLVEVYTIEIVPELAESAAQRLRDLGYDRVHVRQGDGYYGWPDAAPFDAIIVTAAPDHLPAPLVEQLSDDGRIVIPIGPPGGFQSLWKFVQENSELVAYNQGGVAFVPFTGAGIEGDTATTTP